MRKLYKITLNYSGEVYTFYRWASREIIAFNLAIHALEKKLNLVRGALRNVFQGDKNNFEIKEDI